MSRAGRSSWILLAAGAVVLTASIVLIRRPRAPADDGAVDAQRAALSPPRAALPGEARATVILAACTGARVGPRHYLTAAHCVVDPGTGRLKGWLEAGFPITIENTPDYPIDHPRILGSERGAEEDGYQAGRTERISIISGKIE